MAYNANPYQQVYMPSSYNTVLPVQQPYNGIVQVNDVDEAIQKSNLMPPKSVSNPYFLPDGETYVVVFKDQNGNVTTRHYRYEDVTPDPMSGYVTREDFAAAINEIKEAINGKPTADGAAGDPGAGK